MRTNPKDASNHQIIGMVPYNPTDFANQIGLSTSNMWGILKHIVDKCLALDEGTYVLVKDPSKSVARLYRVPEGALEDNRGGDDESQDGNETVRGDDQQGDQD